MTISKQPLSASWKDELLFAVLIITASWCVGLVVNQFRDHPLPLVYESKAERLENTVRSLSVEAKPIPVSAQSFPSELSLGDFEVFVKQGKGLVFDARPEIFHRFGHVPSAISLPREDFEAAYTRLKDRLETKHDQLLAVYCSSISCEDAQLVQAALQKLGYAHVAVFRGGWDEWTRARLPEEKTP